jgi:hypothetical protein
VLVGLAIARDDDLGLAQVLADAPLELVGAGLPLGVTPLALARGGAAQGMEEALGNTLGIRCHRPSILEQMGAGLGTGSGSGAPDRRTTLAARRFRARQIREIPEHAAGQEPRHGQGAAIPSTSNTVSPMPLTWKGMGPMRSATKFRHIRISRASVGPRMPYP